MALPPRDQPVATGSRGDGISGAKVKKKRTVVKAPAGDVASSGGDYGIPKAKRAAAKSPTVKRNTAAVYAQQPVPQRKRILKHATGPTAKVVHDVHEQRRQRAEDIAHAQAAHDIMTAADKKTADAFNAAHPTYAKVVDLTKNKREVAAGGPLGQVTGINFRKALGNAPKDAFELAVTTPSSVAKLASTAVTHPTKVPGMLAAPYKQLIKDPKGFIENHPVSAALMVSPAARAPGLAVGKVARLAGRQTLARPTATLAGTALKETRTGSRDFTIRAMQARRDAKTPAPAMTATQVQKRVDATYAAGKTHAQRVEASAYKQAKKTAKTLPKDQRRAAIQTHVEGARGGARNQADIRFAKEFGATARLSPNVTVRKVFHGSTKHPTTIMAEGLKPSRPEGLTGDDPLGVYFSDAPKTARVYGPHIYEVDASALRDFVTDPHGGPGASFTPHHVPAAAIRYAGKGGAWDEALVRELDKAQAGRAIQANAPRALLKPKNATEGVLHDTREEAQAVADALNRKQPTIARGTRMYGKEQLPNEFKVMAAGDKHAVVPAVAKARLNRQRSVGTSKATVARMMRQSRSLFTKAVLPYRPTWLSGQAIEGTVRAAVQGAGPTSYLRARRTIGAMEAIKPGSGKALLERAAPGGLIGHTAAHELTPRTLHEEFGGESNIARALTDLGQAPGVRQVRQLHHAVSSFVFEKVNAKTLEGIPQTAMLGRALKQSPLMERNIIGLSDKAIQDAAKGLQATENQVQLARAVERAYGKYQGFNPKLREAIMHWTPFIPWYLNTVQFLLSVLPKDHPAAAALAADAGVATEDWRKKAGLSTRGGETLPSFMLGGYPTHGGKTIERLAHYTPFGVGQDVTGAVTSLPLPQVMPSFMAVAASKDWKGHDLKHPDGTPFNQGEKWLYALTQLGESLVPLASQTAAVAGASDKTAALKKQFRLISSTPSNRATAPGPGVVTPVRVKPIRVKPVRIKPVR